MRNAADILKDAESLPVEERVALVDRLLRSLNAPNPEIDRKWAKVATRRLAEVGAGRARPIPADQVFEEIREWLAM